MRSAQDNNKKIKHAVVLVLGDIGRSPRMQYHALSLLEEGHYVTLIGYAGESLIPQLEIALSDDSDTPSPQPNNAPFYRGHLHMLRMQPYQPPKTNIIYSILYYPIRLLSLLYCMVYTLWIQLKNVPHTTIPVDVILVQNPPSLPTLLLTFLYCVWQGGVFKKSHRPRFVIDWHNLGYTMFDSTTFIHKSIRKVAYWYERKMAPLADAHLTVTEAMEVWLGENFNVHGEQVRVLYDKPPIMFQPTSIEEQHELFRRLDLVEKQFVFTGEKHLVFHHDNIEDILEETVFTQCIRKSDGKTSIRLRKDRPALLVSSTSWTPDEDFSILLEALKELDKTIKTKSDDGKRNTIFPKVLVIVTGKGPQKSYYLPLLKDFNATHPSINIQTLWLEACDYPKLLGCATLGISLHTSTSGLDLPMKVLDMFGCQVPVCAIGFDCLHELVKDGVNGKVFDNADELAHQLHDLLVDYPSDNALNKLEVYRRNIHGMKRWKENWEECARHLIVG